MWSHKLVKNKIHAVLFILLGALSVPVEWGCNVLFIYPDYGWMLILFERELDL